METTWNFQAGLRAAYNELAAEGKITKEAQVVGEICGARRGQRWVQAIRSHRAVRREYCRQLGRRVVGAINWTAIKEWIKANWVTILKIILAIAPLLLLDRN